MLLVKNIAKIVGVDESGNQFHVSISFAICSTKREPRKIDFLVCCFDLKRSRSESSLQDCLLGFNEIVESLK